MENYIHKGKRHLIQWDPYITIIKDKILLAFLNVEKILQLFLSLIVTSRSGER
jgi:hypothetical protein